MAKREAHCWAGWWVLTGLVIVVSLTILQSAFVIKGKGWFGIDPNLFGDSFGAMNAVISGLAFIAFIVTLIMQGRELKLQRAELEDTRYELRGARRAQEAQVQMSLQSARIASLAAILNHKFHQFTTQPAQRQGINIDMNRWNAELEAEITSLHYAGQPWSAANAMLHQASVELQTYQSRFPSITFPVKLPDELTPGLARALTDVEGLLDQSAHFNAALENQDFTDQNDPLKPIVLAWLFKARECLQLGVRQQQLDAEEGADVGE
ncbi:MAG: hypothetical protein WCK05_04615 [Planctomycetota bacterium]